MFRKVFSLLVLMVLLAACQPTPAAVPTQASTAAPTAVPEPTLAPTAAAEPTAPKAEAPVVTIYAPSSTTSVPIILAAKNLPNTQVNLFDNHPQANAQFTKEDNAVLVTGLSVGLGLYRNGMPIKMLNTNVAGLSYLVGCDIEVNSFEDLKGKEVYLPFEGSPLEETTAFFVEKAGLVWNTDVKPVYAPFDSSLALVRQGTPLLVALGEPSVSALAGQPCFKLGPDYFAEWNRVTSTDKGYPQVAAFAKQSFLEANQAWVEKFNEALIEAVAQVTENPAGAAAEVKDMFKFPEAVLLKALENTRFAVESGTTMQDSVNFYYTTIGKPLDEKDQDFFYTLP